MKICKKKFHENKAFFMRKQKVKEKNWKMSSKNVTALLKKSKIWKMFSKSFTVLLNVEAEDAKDVFTYSFSEYFSEYFHRISLLAGIL